MWQKIKSFFCKKDPFIKTHEPVTKVDTLDDLKRKCHGLFPLSTIVLANNLGIKVYSTKEFDRTIAGSITKQNGKFIIYVNESEFQPTVRFVVMYAIVMILEHKNILDECDEYFIMKKLSIAKNIDVIKTVLELLMPEEAFEECWNKASEIEDVTNTFKISKSIAAVRSYNLFGEMFL
jgi:Zn-dependent peptidase ImmA (M78 family)